MLVLGIESSCDETAAALVADGRRILSSVVASQVEIHARFGGVVPEVASRAHAECVSRVIERAFLEAGVPPGKVDGLAVTLRPGLAGSLLVGVSAASALALAWDRPIVGVHHLHAHAYAPVLAGVAEYPFACLVASGGHTSIYECRGPLDVELLGSTIDDAAGEAFDKAAAVLGLGFPGGPAVSRAASGGDPEAFDFPRSKLADEDDDFSFSGLKTALLYAVEGPGLMGPKLELTGKVRADLAASFEQAVCEILAGKLVRAALRRGLRTAALSGGVAANRRLRAMLAGRAAAEGLEAAVAPPELCTDNAAMVAGLGHHQLMRGEGRGPDRLRLEVVPELERPGRSRGR
jgi:N6-L-threonylcarbamoyladenine synthase